MEHSDPGNECSVGAPSTANDEYLLAATGPQMEIWNAATGRPRAALEGCSGGWRAVGFAAPDTFLEACGDGMIREWGWAQVLAEMSHAIALRE